MLPTLASAHEQGLVDFQLLEWPLPAQGHARADRPEAARCSRGDDRQPIGASTAERDREVRRHHPMRCLRSSTCLQCL
jgi:hypothetical protein